MSQQSQTGHYYEGLAKQLWQENAQGESPIVYAIFDGARDKRISEKVKQGELKYSCLYEGRLSYKMSQAAPYMVRLEKNHPETYQWIEQAWGNSWGIYMVTYPPATLLSVRHNCRKVAVVRGPDGKPLVFRYYDPRVLRTYLPTCDDVEADKIFGPITEFVVEGDNAEQIHRFRRTTEGVQDINRGENSAELKPVIVESFFKKESSRSPLVLRREQMAEFGKKQLPKYIDQAESYITREFPEFAQQKKGLLREWIRLCYEQAKSYGMMTTRDHIKYINYICIFGEDFVDEYAFAEEILNSNETAKSKLADLKAAFVDHLNRDR